MSGTVRSASAVTLSVWKALFLREAVSRISSGRAAWAWLLFEPVVHVAFILVLFTLVRMRVVPGAEAAVWLLVGLSSFFTARNIYSRGMEAINANEALFAYRQVIPVDAVLVRAALEAFLGVIVAMLLLVGAGLFGFQVVPHDPLGALAGFAGLCLCGLGLGLILSVASELVPELGKVARLLFTPLYFLSGVMFPVSLVPPQYREILFYNPFAHGLELARGAFFPLYHAAPEASFGYLYGFALTTIFLGLSLQVRYAVRLRAQ
ncbi:ABC transporter permease [Aromatoleum sp.]|uniref:ABC transporter permease n=1 Tax=Aromatoleum sp. TaxID=2307007 RepID=UPI002FC93479